METTQKNREPVRKRPEGQQMPRKKAEKRPSELQTKPARKAAPAKPEKKTAAVKKQPEKALRKTEEEDIPNKKRAYGKSKPRKPSALSQVTQTVRKTTRKRKVSSSRPKQPTPVVIYTEPRAFNRNRFLVQMLTVTAVVAAFVMGLSVFFKVKTVEVTGADVYSVNTIREASGISEGDNLLTFSHARAAAQLKANLPYINTVRFGIKLPDTVNIIVEEAEVVYAVKDANGQWWLMNSAGRVVEQINGGVAANYTQILGVALESPAVNLQAVAAEAAPTETDASGEFIPITVTGAQRLNTAMQILKAMESNDIVGEVASVDVTRTEDIVLWYGSRYQVNLGDSARLDYKIAYMNDAIVEELKDYQSGILDVSFKIRPNEAMFTPFG